MRVIRGNDSWGVEYIGVGGWTVRKWFPYEEDAQSWVDKHSLASELQDGQSVQHTLSDALVRYFDEHLRNTRTAAGHASHIDVLCRTDIARLPLRQVTTKRLSDYCADKAREASARTVHQDMRIIRRALEYALRPKSGRAPRNPAMGVILPPLGPRKVRQKLLAADVQRIIDALAKYPAAQSVVRFALETGLDRMTVLRLHRGQVSLESQTATVTRGRHKEELTVALSDDAMAILASQPDFYGKYFGVSADKFDWQWRSATKKADLPDARLGDLHRAERSADD